MKLTKELAENILEAMFSDYSFDFEVEVTGDDSFEAKIVSSSNVENETMDFEIEMQGVKVAVKVYKSWEYKLLGYYYLADDEYYKAGQFEPELDFWETMFILHLK